ncbi:MAG: HAD family hydrolase [Anaerofustis sp.]
MSYHTFVFDFDFTLADGSRAIVQCANYALEQLGFNACSDLAIRKTVGMTLENTFTVLSGSCDNCLSAQFVTSFKESADRIMTKDTVLFDDTIRILSCLKKEGHKTAIVTSKLHRRIDEVFLKYDAPGLVDEIIGFDDVSYAKPDPEGLLLAMDHLSADKENVLYIGDTVIDAETARNAGVNFGAVTTGVTLYDDFLKFPYVAIGDSLTALLQKIGLPV